MAKGVSNNLIGVAGEYFVCAELCRRGFLALLTPKNNPLYDVVVTDPAGTMSAAIQVKTRSITNTQGWKLGIDIAEKKGNPSLFVALVALQQKGFPDIWVYEFDALAERISELFAAYIGKPRRDGQKRVDPGFRWHDLRYFDQRDHARKSDWSPVIDRLTVKLTNGSNQ